MIVGATPGSLAWDRVTDVLIVGFGAAGCAAAIEAHRVADVLVLEKMPVGQEGGNTRVSGGVWFDNQDPDRAATYLRHLNGCFPVAEPIIQAWAYETARNTDWIESLSLRAGIHSTPAPEYPGLPCADVQAGYVGVDGVQGRGRLWEALSGVVEELGIPVVRNARAKELVQTIDGEVIGAVCEIDGEVVRVQARRGVVLATGGFESNSQMVRDFLGVGGEPSVWGSPSGTGDGIKMAMKAGADLWHMDNMMSIVGLTAPDFTSGFPIYPERMGYIFVAPDGTRFVDEAAQVGHGHAVLNGSYELFPRSPMCFVFDEEQRLSGPLCPRYEDLPVGYNLVIEGYDWSVDNSAEMEKGWFCSADTLAELAVQLGLPPDTLTATVERYNKACDARTDDQFGRAADTLLPLRTPPFHGFVWGPVLAWTNGGPRRNERSEVIDVFGEVIPRLYAAGAISSTYSWAKDGGFHIADALAFGRIAGRTAAAAQPSSAALEPT